MNETRFQSVMGNPNFDYMVCAEEVTIKNMISYQRCASDGAFGSGSRRRDQQFCALVIEIIIGFWCDAQSLNLNFAHANFVVFVYLVHYLY